MEPIYWRDRLFRNTFTYKGRLRQVNHWSVKIQHLGTRKTFSLRATASKAAAAEACHLYKTIVTRRWESVDAPGNGKNPVFRASSGAAAAAEANDFGAG